MDAVGRLEPAQHADRDREEREVGGDDRDREPLRPRGARRGRSGCRCALTIGAKAMSGTVWLTTIQGSRPHSASRQRCMTQRRAARRRARRSASRRRRCRGSASAAVITETKSGGVLPPLVGSNSRATMSQMCGIARSLVRGSSMTPEPVSPSIAPTDDALGRAEELVEPPRAAARRARRARPSRT